MRKYLLLVSLVLSSNVQSITELEYSFGSYVYESTNVSQTALGDEGNVWESIGEFSFESTDVKNWEFRLDSSASIVDYSDSTIEDEDTVRLSAITRYAPQGTNFYLDLLENLSQVPANRFRTEGVNNQRDSNIFAASPNYFFRFSPVTRVNFGYQYIDYEIESDSELLLLQDNDRIERQGSISLINQINPASELALVVQSKDVDFENEGVELGSDFTQEDYLLRWTNENRTSNFSFGVGRFKVEDIQGNIAEDDQYRLFFSRQINRRQSIDFQALRGVAQLFTINAATGTISISQQNNAITRAQLSKGGGIQYQYADTLLSTNIGYFENELTGLFEQSRELRSTYNFRLTYSLSRLLGTPLPRLLTFNATHTKNEFDIELSNVSENSIQTVELDYTHFTSRNWSFTISYLDRTSDILSTAFVESSQDSRSLMIGFTYRREMEY